MSKKFLLSTALVFALLVGKSFATDANKPLESEDVSSIMHIVPVTSEEIAPIGIDDMPNDTITHTLSFADAADLRVFALTSKGNYILAEKRLPYLNTSLNLDCFEPNPPLFFNDTFKSDQIRIFLEKKFENGDYNNLTTDLNFIILYDIIKYCEIQNYRLTSSLKKIIEECRQPKKFSDYGKFLCENFEQLYDQIFEFRSYVTIHNYDKNIFEAERFHYFLEIMTMKLHKILDFGPIEKYYHYKLIKFLRLETLQNFDFKTLNLKESDKEILLNISWEIRHQKASLKDFDHPKFNEIVETFNLKDL
ncbi:MAG: hypothetical protein ACRYGR_07565 [Janthinobacterium lividum]